MRNLLKIPGIKIIMEYVNNQWKNYEFIFIFLLVLTPILQHYKGIIGNASFTILILLLPIFFIKFLNQIDDLKYRILYPVLPLITFVLYKLFMHGFNFKDLVYAILMSSYYVLIASRVINTRLFLKITTGVALFASFLIVVQYVSYYLFHFHLQLVPTSFLLPESEQWVLLAKTGLISILGKPMNYYRPSSFFLEPSHMFLYLSPIILIILLAPQLTKERIRIAIILTIGLLLSTSGMGVLAAFGIWSLFILKYYFAHKPSMNSIIIVSCILIVVISSFVFVPFLNKSLTRIIGTNGEGSAISGRTTSGMRLIRNLKGQQFWFGVSDQKENIEFHLAGFNNTMYRYGIIGTLLSYVFYVYNTLKLGKHYFWFGIMVIVMSFFTAHTHGTFYMLYFAIVFIDGYTGIYRDKDNPPFLHNNL